MKKSIYASLLPAIILINVNIQRLTAAPVTRDSSHDFSAVAAEEAIKQFMDKYKVPGLSIAVGKDGKIVYARGFGVADSAANKKVNTQSQFRIASLSKPITAVAILRLAEQGKFSLDDKVFGEGGVLGTAYGTQPYREGISSITIRQLLSHISGGWQNNGDDPMFHNKDLTADQLISHTLNNQPLKNKPGTAYAYSNFGYCVLGRVIEKVTGKPYEKYMLSEILRPAGVKHMEVGGNTADEKRKHEVMYYSRDRSAYLDNVTRMDAHGGWIATPTDLVKFLWQVDGFNNKPDILQPASIREMTTPSKPNPSYALGWSVAGATWKHTGSLPGTGAEMIRTGGGYCCAVLVNTKQGGDFFKDLDILVKKITGLP